MAELILLSPEERATIATWARGRSLPMRVVERARIVQMAADGMLSRDIARELRISRPTVQLWRQRFLAFRLAGLEKHAPRPGRIPSIPEKTVQAVIEATPHTTPSNATHGSTRRMAEAHGISWMTVQRIWEQHNIKPHLIRTFKLSHDTRFIEKLYDVVGLHLIVDNYGTHKHPRVKSWLRQHPRFHLHFIPTSSSWLNVVERWFHELTEKRIRRGSFGNVRELITAINA